MLLHNTVALKATFLCMSSLLVLTATLCVPSASGQASVVGIGGSSVSCASLTGPIVYINPASPAGGNGTISAPYNAWASVPSYTAGTRYLQAAGTTDTESSVLIIGTGTSGTTGAIVIGSYGSGNAPVLNGELVIGLSNYVQVCGMTIYGGVAIAGSNNIIIHGNTIENSPNIGVWIGTTGTTQSGGGTYIDGNMIEGNAGDGIALNNTATTSTSSPSTTIYVTQNDIIQNGAHGIEVESNYITVSGNFVNTNGLTVGGTSGIHCLGSSTTPYTGNYNSITFNVTSNQEDNETGGNGQDGNGLEADGQTIGNVFVQNLSFGNDGAGIVLYDSASNSVSGNVTYGNGINHLGSHSYPGEFVILDDASLTKNNAAGTNVFLSDHATTAAVQFEVSTSFGNTFGGNYEENAASTEVYDLTGTKGNTLSYWNNTLHATDKFSGVTVKAPTGAYYYGFASGTKWTINGRTYTMAGWNASNGAIYGQ